MKRFWIAILLCTVMAMPCIAASADDQVVKIFVTTADTYVSSTQPDDNYGQEPQARTIYSQTMHAYLAFDMGGEEGDPLVLDPPNPNLGSWYEFDVTALAKRRYNGDKKLWLMLGQEQAERSDKSSSFYTKEAEQNRPYLKLVLNNDEKTVVSAKIYLFGGEGVLYSLDAPFDENTLTYNTRPPVDGNLGMIAEGKMMEEMSGNVALETYGVTIEGKSEYELNHTTMTKFENAFADDIPTWSELYDSSQIPSVSQLEADYQENIGTVENVHPRTRGTYEDWQNVKKWTQEEDLVIKWKEAIVNSADRLVENWTVPMFAYNSSNQLVDTGSNIPKLAYAYLLTDEEVYAQLCYESMLAIAQYPHWNHSTAQLNTGACALNVGLGYDLIYDYMSPDQRQLILDGATKNAFQPMLGFPNQNTNNWNPVVNGGLGVLAVAMYDEMPYECGQMISQSIGAIPKSLMQYYPDGGFPEGPSYWAYMLENLCNFLSALNDTFGSDYGLGDFPGLENTGYFPIFLQGPTQDLRFKYGDDRSKYTSSVSMFYLAKRYNNPAFAYYQIDIAQSINNYEVLAPYWFTEDLLSDTGNLYDGLDLDKYFDGQNPVGTMRSAWGDPNGLFVGFKGGYPQISHADMDAGTFTLAALGEEWAVEVPGGDYGRLGYPSLFRMGRYMYYAASPQGHNTLVFNPGVTYPAMEYGQSLTALPKITQMYSGDDSAYSVIDLSQSYRKYASSVKRGVALIRNRQEFLVQDEIRSGGTNTIYWFMHTKKEVEVDGDTAILTEGNKRLYCKILAPAGAEFSLMEAKALPGTPSVPGFDDHVNQDIHKLTIKTDIEGSGTISVWMVPLAEGDSIPKNPPTVTSIENWPLQEQDNVKLGSVRINGEIYEEFSPDYYVYDVRSEDKDFDVSVESCADNVEYTITKNNGTVRIECSDKEGKLRPSRYVFTYTVEADSNITVTASDVPQPDNAPINTLDGDFDTRWASENEQWIAYDLGQAEMLESVSVAFYRGESRRYNFSIEISSDGENYTTIYDGQSSGTSAQLTKYEFEPQLVRYVRINCNANNENTWNNVSEVVFGYVTGIAEADEEE